MGTGISVSPFHGQCPQVALMVNEVSFLHQGGHCSGQVPEPVCARAKPGYPSPLPGNPSQWCQANRASSMDTEVLTSRQQGVEPCWALSNLPLEGQTLSHPAEFPKGWSRVGRQNETCGRDWRVPSIYACIPNP